MPIENLSIVVSTVVWWGLLQRERLPKECPGYDTKQSDAKIPVLLGLWGVRSTPSLLSLPVSLCSGVLAPDSVLSMGQIELLDV